MSLDVAAVRKALEALIDPATGKPVAEAGVLKDVSVDDAGKVSVKLSLEAPVAAETPHRRAEIGKGARAAVEALPGVTGVEVQWADGPPPRAVGAEDPLPGVKNVI